MPPRRDGASRTKRSSMTDCGWIGAVMIGAPGSPIVRAPPVNANGREPAVAGSRADLSKAVSVSRRPGYAAWRRGFTMNSATAFLVLEAVVAFSIVIGVHALRGR